MTRKHDCYADGCRDYAGREIRGIRMCDAHYIEALEHCADLVFDNVRAPVKVKAPEPCQS